MQYKLLDTVVLDTDLPEHGLKTGDLGAVVEIYEPDGLEIEFVCAAGQTQSLVTLKLATSGLFSTPILSRFGRSTSRHDGRLTDRSSFRGTEGSVPFVSGASP